MLLSTPRDIPLLPAALGCRAAREIAGVYRFARGLDDFVDDPRRPVAAKTGLLTTVSDWLRSPSAPELARAIRSQCRVPLDGRVLRHAGRLRLFVEHLQLDAAGTPLRDRAAFDGYYRGVAGVFGDIVCDAFGESSEAVRAAVRTAAIRLGILTQLRDVPADLAAGRRVCGLEEQVAVLGRAAATDGRLRPEIVAAHVQAVLAMLPPPASPPGPGSSATLGRYLAAVEAANAILTGRLLRTPGRPDRATLGPADRLVVAWRFLRG